MRHCFTQKILVFISVPCKAVLGIYTRKNKIKVSMQRIVNESDYCKKWNLREARKLTMVFLKNIYQGTGVLNYKRMFRHLLEIYTLYVTIETFICFSTYSTWVAFVISTLLLLCVRFFHLFYTQKIEVKIKNQNIWMVEWN